MTPSLPRSSHDDFDEPLDLTEQVGAAPAEIQRPEPVWVDVPEQQPETGADGRQVPITLTLSPDSAASLLVEPCVGHVDPQDRPGQETALDRFFGTQGWRHVPDGPERPATLLGLFEGRGISERFTMETGELPNRIRLYRRPILDYWAENEETLGDIITHVLIHEIGHHFGLSDDDMERIEASAEEATDR